MTADDWYAAIDADPGNHVIRGAFADWLDEHAGTDECSECEGTGYGLCVCGLPYCDHRYPGPAEHGHVSTVYCDICSGTGSVPDRNARLAAGYRALAEYGRAAKLPVPDRLYWWFGTPEVDDDWANDCALLPMSWRLKMPFPKGDGARYPTRCEAEDAAALAWADATDEERAEWDKAMRGVTT